MPRITDARREARRAQIVAAARRCFSRDGFHQTSMPDIAREAGVATGSTYGYFASKEELIVEIAGAAFAMIFDPLTRLVDEEGTPSMADLVDASLTPLATDDHDVEEMLRCAVQAWGELLRHEGLRERAVTGVDGVLRRIAEALRQGQAAGTVPAGLDPERGARIVMALLHGFLLQRVAFGLDDARGLAADVRVVLTDAGVLRSDGDAQ